MECNLQADFSFRFSYFVGYFFPSFVFVGGTNEIFDDFVLLMDWQTRDALIFFGHLTWRRSRVGLRVMGAWRGLFGVDRAETERWFGETVSGFEDGTL